MSPTAICWDILGEAKLMSGALPASSEEVSRVATALKMTTPEACVDSETETVTPSKGKQKGCWSRSLVSIVQKTRNGRLSYANLRQRLVPVLVMKWVAFQC